MFSTALLIVVWNKLTNILNWTETVKNPEQWEADQLAIIYKELGPQNTNPSSARKEDLNLGPLHPNH